MRISRKILMSIIMITGVMLITGIAGFSAVPVNVQISMETGVRAPTKAQDEIRGLTQSLVLEQFRSDATKSSLIMADTKIVSEIKGGFRCETLAGYLYEKTYTLKLNLIRWDYVRGSAENIRTRENYLPEEEATLHVTQTSKPGTQIGEKEKTQKGLRAPKGEMVKPNTQLRARTDVNELKSGEVRTPWYKQAKGFANCPVGPGYKCAWSMTYYIASVMHWRTGNAWYARGTAASVYNNKMVLGQGTRLLYYSNIGHGCPNALAMSGGYLWASWINPYPYKWGIVGAVMFVNSCNSFKNPIRSAFYPANWARVYISGATPLYVNCSECVDAWFWYFGLVQHRPANQALALARSYASSYGCYGGCCRRCRNCGTFGLTGYAPTSPF